MFGFELNWLGGKQRRRVTRLADTIYDQGGEACVFCGLKPKQIHNYPSIILQGMIWGSIEVMVHARTHQPAQPALYPFVHDDSATFEEYRTQNSYGLLPMVFMYSILGGIMVG